VFIVKVSMISNFMVIEYSRFKYCGVLLNMHVKYNFCNCAITAFVGDNKLNFISARQYIALCLARYMLSSVRSSHGSKTVEVIRL